MLPFPAGCGQKGNAKKGNPAKSDAFRAGKKQERQRKKGKEPKYVAFPRPEQAEISNKPKIKRSCALYRPQKVRPKNLTIGGRYFYG